MISNAEKTILPIEIISDVVCPWCYVGKKKLEMALEQFRDQVVPQIRWRPFQLSPEIPESGVNYKEHLTQKFGSLRALDGAWQKLAGIGKEVGIDFHFEKIEKAPNTIFLHAIISQVEDLQKRSEIVERLFIAHFTEGLDLTDKNVVKNILEPYNLDKAGIDTILSNPQILDEIKQEITYYRQNGVSGVPFFILGERYSVTGAQNTEVFVDIIRTILSENSSLG